MFLMPKNVDIHQSVKKVLSLYCENSGLDCISLKNVNT